MFFGGPDVEGEGFSASGTLDLSLKSVFRKHTAPISDIVPLPPGKPFDCVTYDLVKMRYDLRAMP